jgi:hypothetical protein
MRNPGTAENWLDMRKAAKTLVKQTLANPGYSWPLRGIRVQNW